MIKALADQCGLDAEDENPPEYWYLCPVHGDSNASLHLDDTRDVWYCFGCSTGGGPKEFLEFLDRTDIRLEPEVPKPRVSKEIEEQAGMLYLTIAALSPFEFDHTDEIESIDRAAMGKHDLVVIGKCQSFLYRVH